MILFSIQLDVDASLIYTFDVLKNNIMLNLGFVLMGMIGPWQVVLIIAIVLILFGGRKIPELMRGLGGGVKEFKNAVKEDEEDASEDKK